MCEAQPAPLSISQFLGQNKTMIAIRRTSAYWLVAHFVLWLTVCGAVKPSTPLPYHTVAQFPVGVALENIAVRPNGNLLVTSLTPNASLYEISNPSTPSPVIILHYTNDNATSLLGITETSPDTYAFIAGSFSAAGGTRGSYSVYTADFTCRDRSSRPPSVSLVTHIPEASLLNGAATAVNKAIILVADSPSGVLYRVDLRNKTYSIAAALPEMSSGQPWNPFAMGINGVHVHKRYLYWTNDFQRLLYRISISDDGLISPGAKAELVADLSVLTGNVDDFTFASEGMVYVATNSDNLLLAVAKDGRREIVLGAAGDLTVAGASAMQLGRTESDKGTLYVTTGGARINGTVTGGKVEAVEAHEFV